MAAPPANSGSASGDPFSSPYNRSFNSLMPRTASGREPMFMPKGWAAAQESHPLQLRQFGEHFAAMGNGGES